MEWPVTVDIFDLLASILLVALAEPIVRLLFQYGDKFDVVSCCRVSVLPSCAWRRGW